MLYVSTRAAGLQAPPARRFGEILLEGLAPDGGLYVPERYPQADLASLRRCSYPDLAFRVLSYFIDDVPHLNDLVQKTYQAKIFGSVEITPLKTLEPGLHLLQLSNGPTAAFKDVAMQLLGNLFQEFIEQQKDKKLQLNILGATSGDTGTAAEYAMRGKRGIRVFMLSPHNRMSEFQRAQMYSLPDPNIHNLA
ncbi:MAG TPA: threonine synthase, partial [Burkholderiales bacterium]|nr:threonine synthase [Burkholderiales bacterium]